MDRFQLWQIFERNKLKKINLRGWCMAAFGMKISTVVIKQESSSSTGAVVGIYFLRFTRCCGEQRNLWASVYKVDAYLVYGHCFIQVSFVGARNWAQILIYAGECSTTERYPQSLFSFVFMEVKLVGHWSPALKDAETARKSRGDQNSAQTVSRIWRLS